MWHSGRLWVAGLLWLGLASGQAMGFMLTAPAPGSVLQSGQQVAVAIDPGVDIAVGRVRYYWYRLGEEPIVWQQATPALIATSATTPPYGGILTVPSEALGTMRLLAVGEVTSGRLAGREEFDEVLVQVEPPAALSRIEFAAEKPLRLRLVGIIMDVPAVGLFADGMSRPILGRAAGSAYASSNEEVLVVSPEGALRVVGDGTAAIVVTNRGLQGRLDVVVKTDGEPNQPPVAHAGPDQTVKGGSTVILNALRSLDPDGDPLRYEWRQIRGNMVSLLDANTSNATFVAPLVTRKRLFRFRLQVTDMKGPDTVRGADSVPSFVDVWVIP